MVHFHERGVARVEHPRRVNAEALKGVPNHCRRALEDVRREISSILIGPDNALGGVQGLARHSHARSQVTAEDLRLQDGPFATQRRAAVQHQFIEDESALAAYGAVFRHNWELSPATRTHSIIGTPEGRERIFYNHAIHDQIFFLSSHSGGPMRLDLSI